LLGGVGDTGGPRYRAERIQMLKATAALIQCGLRRSLFQSLRMATCAKVDAGVPSRQSQSSFGTGSVLVENASVVFGGVSFRVSGDCGSRASASMTFGRRERLRNVRYHSLALREL